ncbi:hypothetical protein HK098_006724 [Nowakowskiella sp. JEL0407]|nr:hypothetical protein HK098_006724 [Nowakowskiella sp. JEL0407]
MERSRNVSKLAFARPLKIPVFIKSVSKLLTTLHDLPEKNFEIYVFMQQLTLDVLGQAIFSFDFQSLNELDGGPYVKMWKEISNRIFDLYVVIFPYATVLPTKWNHETWLLSTI